MGLTCDDMVCARSWDMGAGVEVIVCVRPGGGSAPKMDEKAASRWKLDAWP